MLTHFDKVFRIDFLLDKQKPILIGVSGGPDSLCLLDLLHKCGYLVIIAHMNHKLRPEADAEARSVEGLAASLRVEFALEECNIRALAEKTGQSIEGTARQARYRFLFRQAEEIGAQAVAAGHNADDQVETVLMHLLQGTGLAGLMGMQPITLPNPWSEEIPLVRPLLSTWSDQILEYCRTNHLEPLFDRSNEDTKFLRNRLRHELIPQLEEYAPGVKSRLWQTADILAADRAVLDDAVALARHSCLLEQGDGYVSFDALSLSYQPLSVRRGLVKWAMSMLRSDIRDLSFEAVERATSLLESAPRAGQQDIALGVSAFLEEGVFYLADRGADLPSKQWPQMPSNAESLVIDLPGRIDLADGWQITAKVHRAGEIDWEQVLNNRDPYRAWVDVGEQATSLNVRGRSPGDRFSPFGMGGNSKKLSDLMIDLKIPQRARARWPLICRGDEILWLPGFRQAHGYGLNEESRRIVFLQLLRPS